MSGSLDNVLNAVRANAKVIPVEPVVDLKSRPTAGHGLLQIVSARHVTKRARNHFFASGRSQFGNHLPIGVAENGGQRQIVFWWSIHVGIEA